MILLEKQCLKIEEVFVVNNLQVNIHNKGSGRKKKRLKYCFCSIRLLHI